MLVILNIGNTWDTFGKTNGLCFLKLLLGNDSIKNYQRLFKGLYNHFCFKYWVFYSNPLDCWKMHFRRRKCWKYIIPWSVFLLHNVLGIKLWQLEWNFSFNCYLPFKYWVFYSNPLDCWKMHFRRRKCWKYIIPWSVFLLHNVLGIKLWQLEWNFSFNCYLAVPQPALGHSQEDSLTNPMLITVFVQVWPKGHQESCNQVGSLSPAESLADFEPGTFQFWLPPQEWKNAGKTTDHLKTFATSWIPLRLLV